MSSVLSCLCSVIEFNILPLFVHSMTHLLTRLSVASIILQIKVERQIKFIVFVL